MNDRPDASTRQALSALVDGEADARGAASLSALWRDDAEARACWHRYQLIGDALRSEELAGQDGDAAFLARLRARLEQEPVVLAPSPKPVAPARPRSAMRRWAPPAAVAAGFLAVAGALTVMRGEAPSAMQGGELTQAPATAPVLAVAAPVVTAAASAEPAAASAAPPLALAENAVERPEPVERVTGRLLRDARLDRYLTAHKQFGGSSALAPSGFLRNATYEGPAAAVGSR